MELYFFQAFCMVNRERRLRLANAGFKKSTMCAMRRDSEKDSLIVGCAGDVSKQSVSCLSLRKRMKVE